MVHDGIACHALPALQSIFINVHAFIPAAIWTHVVAHCAHIRCIDLTKCEAMDDDILAGLCAAHAGALRLLESFHVRGAHAHDIRLSNRTVELLKERSGVIQTIGDCFTWTMERKHYSVNDIRSLL